ncbi:MAG: MFS transporter [Polyangiaceae bacterium]|jgi:ACS family hexuronate transporter-like MFS transporter
MPSRRLAWIVALVGALTMTVSYFDRTTLAVLAPSVTKALGINATAYGWMTSAFSIAYLLAVPVSGWWIDRVGARRGLVFSVLAWSAVAALHAVVPGFAVLFALRIALGTAEGPSFPGAVQTMSRMLPPADRSRGFGMVFTGSSIGGMLAPPLASFLYDLAGWRVAFLGTSLIGLLWVPLWLALTGRRDVRAQLDKEEVVAAAPSKHPPLLRLVVHPLMFRALLAVLAVAPAAGLAMAWGSKYLELTFGVRQGAMGLYLWLPPVGLDLGALLFGDLAARQVRASAGATPRALFAIAALLAASAGLLPWAATPWQATILFALCLAGGGAVYTLVTADLLGRMPPGRISSVAGVLTAGQSLALIVAHPLIGRAADAYGSYRLISLALAAWVVPGSLLWLAWRPRPTDIPSD